MKCHHHTRKIPKAAWKFNKIVLLLPRKNNIVRVARNILVRLLKDLYYLKLDESDNTSHDAISPSNSTTSEEFDEIKIIEIKEVEKNKST